MGVYQRTNRGGTRTWYALFFVKGKRIREATSARSKKEAELHLAKRQIEVAEGRWMGQKELKKKRPKFNEWGIDYLKLKRLEGLKAISRVELSLKHLVDFFGEIYLDEITGNHIYGYIEKRKLSVRKRIPHKPLAPATINRELSCLKNFLREARKHGKMETEPMFGIKLLREDNVRNRYLTEDEYQRLLDACARHLYGLVVCASESGMRRGEILNLTWQQVDLRKGFIYLKGEETKTGFSRKIPISPILHECLSNQPRSIRSDKVFHYHGKGMGEFKHSWQSALKKAGIEDFRFHDLRHVFVTRMRRAGVHDHVIMAITGHKTREVFRRYDTVDDNDLLDAMVLKDAYKEVPQKGYLNARATQGASRHATREFPPGTPSS